MTKIMVNATMPAKELVPKLAKVIVTMRDNAVSNCRADSSKNMTRRGYDDVIRLLEEIQIVG